MDDEENIILGKVIKNLQEVKWYCDECGEANTLITDSETNTETDFCQDCCENKKINWKQ